MNTANLQLEGLYLAIAAINNALVEKGLLTREEVSTALRSAEQTATGDSRANDLSSANKDAMAFAARFLNLANNSAADGFHPAFLRTCKNGWSDESAIQRSRVKAQLTKLARAWVRQRQRVPSAARTKSASLPSRDSHAS